MRRLLVVSTAVALALVPALAARTDAATEVHHYLDADQIGTTGDDVATDVATSTDLVASAGVVSGPLSGQTAAGGKDAYVRVLHGGVDDDLGVVWTEQLGGPGDDGATSVATDGSRVVAGGDTDGGLIGSSSGPSGWVGLFDASGAMTWSTALGDDVRDVALADDGVYVVGDVRVDDPDWGVEDQGMVWKLDGDGALLWSLPLAPPDAEYQTGSIGSKVLVMDDQVVVAELLYSGSDDDFTRLRALDPATGAEQWRTAGSYQDVSAVLTDGHDIYTAGTTTDGEYEGIHGFVSARTGAGVFRWTEPLNEGHVLGATWDGSAVVAATAPSGADDGALVAVSSDGTHAWATPLPAGLAASAVATGSTELYVAGTTTDELGAPNVGGTDAVVGRFVSYQPDARVRYLHDSRLVGDDFYGATHQRLVVTVEGLKPRTVVVSAQNDGDVVQRLRVTGCSQHGGYAFRYLDAAGRSITRAVTSPSGYRTRPLATGAATAVQVVVKPVRLSSSRSATCRATVHSALDDEDVVKLAIRRR